MEQRGLLGVENQMEVFRAIAEALNETNDVSAAMAAILPRLGSALGLQTAWAFRYDASRKSFVEVGASGLPPALESRGQCALKFGSCECQGQFVRGELAEAVNIVRCSRLREATGDTHNLRFHASIPLRSKGKMLGILNVAAPGKTVFTEESLKFLQTVGQQVAVAVDRARMLQMERERVARLQRLATLSVNWNLNVLPTKLLQQAVETFVEAFHYPVCGVLRPALRGHQSSEDDVIAVSEYRYPSTESPHVYVDPVQAPTVQDPFVQSAFLAKALSAITVPLPMTEYQLRLESPSAGAFDEIDEEVLRAFAGQLATAYVNAQSYAQGMHNVQLEERHRIAADLHDAVSQRLFSAQLLLRTATTHTGESAGAERVQATLSRVVELVAEGQQEMRDLIRALRPICSHTPLVDELRKRVQILATQPRPKVELTIPEGDRIEPPSLMREAILAIVDEALHNALRHANADNISVQIIREYGEMVVSIVDDGRGFQDSDLGAGLGTRTMMERANFIGGALHINGATDVGTKVVLSVPTTIG